MEGGDCASGLLGGETFGSQAKNVEQEKSTFKKEVLCSSPGNSWLCWKLVVNWAKPRSWSPGEEAQEQDVCPSPEVLGFGRRSQLVPPPAGAAVAAEGSR